MIITLKLKPGYSKESIEDFGNHRYLVHITDKDENAIASTLARMFSKYFGVPPHRVLIKSINGNDWVLDIT